MRAGAARAFFSGMFDEKAHDAYLRLQNIKNLIVAEARKLRTGESDPKELDMLLHAEDTIRAEFEGFYLASDKARFE